MFKRGQLIRVVGDSFKVDPHGLEIGSIHEIDSILPAIKSEDIPPMIKLMYALDGTKLEDIPKRIHVKIGEGGCEYANIVFEDVEEYDNYLFEVKMLEDDSAGGFYKGDLFDVYRDDSGEPYIYDMDGDVRCLKHFKHKILY